MYPILLETGPFTLHSLWFIITVAFVISSLVFLKSAQRKKLKTDFLLDHGLSILIFTVLGARLIFMILNWSLYFPPLSFSRFLVFFRFWDHGFSFWGGILGFLLIFLWHCFRAKENFWKWLDVLIAPLFIGIIIGNFGQLLDGQGYGRETILPWGIIFESTNVKYTVPIHPTQIYSMIYCLLIIIFLNKFLKKHPFFGKEGIYSLSGIALYCLIRFFFEFLRGDDSITLGPFRSAQIICLLIFIPVFIFLYRKYQKFRLVPQSPIL